MILTEVIMKKLFFILALTSLSRFTTLLTSETTNCPTPSGTYFRSCKCSYPISLKGEKCQLKCSCKRPDTRDKTGYVKTNRPTETSFIYENNSLIELSNENGRLELIKK